MIAEMHVIVRFDTCCLMPDSSTQFHVEPQDLCPECDPDAYGLFLNEDLFPHLVIYPFIQITAMIVNLTTMPC